jgi:crotonobetainyl-CoA:carnitine CoA-transferase CaiB-like acyl-CoA transferase
MNRMGLGYERLREINPRIVYVQQSGCGEYGSYGSLRAFGPTAAAMAGISDMSGLPEPYPPAGIGYSYLDWFGAYNMALAMMAALYRQRMTGKGCHIDASQVETGLALTGSSILDAQVNRRAWSRYGNRSPHKPAAPHGVYRTRGEDRWLAIACFDDAEWLSLTEVLDAVELRHDERFRTMGDRQLHQDELDAAIETATLQWGGYQLMDALQAKGVAAGVCQTAADRCECDPQLSHLNWRTELPQTEIGTWPVKNDAVSYSMTPSFAGGFLGRSGPNYGEDNEYVYTKILGLSEDEIGALTADGVI